MQQCEATPPRSASTRSAALSVAARKKSSPLRCRAACLALATAMLALAASARLCGGRRKSADSRLPDGALPACYSPFHTGAPFDLICAVHVDLNLCSQRRGQRNIGELSGHRSAILVGPGKKFQCLRRRLGIRRLSIDQNEARASDRPAACAILIRQNEIVALGVAPVCTRGGGLERLCARRDGGEPPCSP